MPLYAKEHQIRFRDLLAERGIEDFSIDQQTSVVTFNTEEDALMAFLSFPVAPRE